MTTDGSNATGISWQAQPTVPASQADNYHVTRSNVQPSVLLGGSTPVLVNSVGKNDSGRVELTISGTVIVPMFASPRYSNRTQIQAANGITVLMTISDPDFVNLDIAEAKAGGSSFVSLWTQVVLTNGYAEIQGSPSGIMFVGTGHVAVVHQ